MQTIAKLSTKIILLFLYLFHYNALFPSEEFIAFHNKLATQFVKKLPLMTFPEADKKYRIQETLTKRMIWHKISRISFENNNDILPVALGLTRLPSEVRYDILSENFGEKKHVFSNQTLQDLDKKTICELFERKAIIERAICKTERIEYFKPFLFEQSLEKLHLVAKLIERIVQKFPFHDNHLSKKELIFFDKLQLYNSSKGNIILSYYAKLTQNKLLECARNAAKQDRLYHALLGLESFLCTRHIAEWNSIKSLSLWMTLAPISIILIHSGKVLLDYTNHYPNKNLADCSRSYFMVTCLSLSTFFATSMLAIIAKIYLPFFSYCVTTYCLGSIIEPFMSEIKNECYTLKYTGMLSECYTLQQSLWLSKIIKQYLEDPSIELV